MCSEKCRLASPCALKIVLKMVTKGNVTQVGIMGILHARRSESLTLNLSDGERSRSNLREFLFHALG
jgi:hypothetical protein